jgi:hypothetical protein
MTKRKSKAERENDARNRAAMKEWTKKLGNKPTPEDMQRALIAATPAQRKYEKEEFGRGKKAGYAWAESGRSIAAVEAVVNFWARPLIAAKKYGPNLRTRWSKRSATITNLKQYKRRMTFIRTAGLTALSPPTRRCKPAAAPIGFPSG